MHFLIAILLGLLVVANANKLFSGLALGNFISYSWSCKLSPSLLVIYTRFRFCFYSSQKMVKIRLPILKTLLLLQWCGWCDSKGAHLWEPVFV